MSISDEQIDAGIRAVEGLNFFRKVWTVEEKRNAFKRAVEKAATESLLGVKIQIDEAVPDNTVVLKQPPSTCECFRPEITTFNRRCGMCNRMTE